MGRYITISDLQNEIPEAIQALTTNDSMSSGVPSSKINSIVEDKIEAAESMFEGYISSRYSLPYLNSEGKPPNIVRQIILTITKYLLYGRRNALRPEIQAQYDSAIQFLMKVQRGVANLPKIDSDGNVEETGEPAMTISTPKDESFTFFV